MALIERYYSSLKSHYVSIRGLGALSDQTSSPSIFLNLFQKRSLKAHLVSMAGTRGKKNPTNKEPAKEEAPAEPENAKLTLAQKKRLKKKQREAAKKLERYV